MDIVLQTHTSDPSLALLDITRSAGFGYVARLQVRSRGFMLDRAFYFDETGLVDFLAAVNSMDRTLVGFAELRHPYKDDFLRLELSPGGSISVTGESREHSDLDQMLRFGFVTDQTVLGPFSRALRAALGTAN